MSASPLQISQPLMTMTHISKPLAAAKPVVVLCCLFYSTLCVGVFSVNHAYGDEPKQVAAEPVYEPTWTSLRRHNIPQWLNDAKFEIYTHWRLSAVGYKKSAGAGRTLSKTVLGSLLQPCVQQRQSSSGGNADSHKDLKTGEAIVPRIEKRDGREYYFWPTLSDTQNWKNQVTQERTSHPKLPQTSSTL